MLHELPVIFFALTQGLQSVALLFLIVIIVSMPLGFLITMLMQSTVKPISGSANPLYVS